MNRKKFAVTLIIILLSIQSSTAFVKAEGQHIAIIQDTKCKSNIVVKTLTKEDKKEFFSSTQSIPIITGSTNKKLEEKVNDNFKTDADAFLREVEREGKSDYEESKKKGIPFRPYEAVTKFSTSFLNNEIISITQQYYQYTGGAHGITQQKSTNIDLNSGKTLTYKDIFKPGTDYSSIIIKEIKKQISENSENFFPEAYGSITTLKEDQPFYLLPDGIVVYYQLYELAPYAAGFSKFKIPYSAFNSQVRPEFQCTVE